MIKSELIETLSAKFTELTEQQVSDAVQHILALMSEALINNSRIEIRGFGSFTIREKQPRHAHNPKTGEKITTPYRKKAHFKPGKKLKERVNQAKK